MTITPKISLSETAAKKVKDLISIHKKKDIKFRIYITGGGCSGFQYQFMFDNIINSDDHIINLIDISIIIDNITLPYLIGGKIDYKENLEGSKFIIINPNATSTCSCGMSFNI
ncbi:MAG: iron-sulfur cluster insertion protein ErpA [Buchnera aphidicola (Eriosoma harunire)]